MCRKIGLWASVLWCVCCVSCGSADHQVYNLPNFEDVRDGRLAVVSEPLVTNLIFGLETFEDKIVVISYMDNCFVHIYDKITGCKLRSFLQRGRADNEVLFVDGYHLDPVSGAMSVYDKSINKIKTFNVSDPVFNGIEAYKSDRILASTTSAIKLDGNRLLLFSGMSDFRKEKTPHRLALVEADGRQSFCDFNPVEDPELSLFVYEQPQISLSPDKNKLAIGTIYGGILETYTIGEDVTNCGVAYFAKPQLRSEMDNMIFGFSDIVAKEECVYSVYNGTKDIGSFSSVAVFNWACEPIRLIKFNGVNLAKICVDSKNDIYAIADLGSGHQIVKVN